MNRLFASPSHAPPLLFVCISKPCPSHYCLFASPSHAPPIHVRTTSIPQTLPEHHFPHKAAGSPKPMAEWGRSFLPLCGLAKPSRWAPRSAPLSTWVHFVLSSCLTVRFFSTGAFSCSSFDLGCLDKWHIFSKARVELKGQAKLKNRIKNSQKNEDKCP